MNRTSVAVLIMAFCALIAQGQTKLSYDNT